MTEISSEHQTHRQKSLQNYHSRRHQIFKKYLDAGLFTVCTANMQFSPRRRYVAGMRAKSASGLDGKGLSWRRVVCSQRDGSGPVWACLQTDVGLFQSCG